MDTQTNLVEIATDAGTDIEMAFSMPIELHEQLSGLREMGEFEEAAFTALAILKERMLLSGESADVEPEDFELCNAKGTKRYYVQFDTRVEKFIVVDDFF